MTSPSRPDVRRRFERILGDSLQQVECLKNSLQDERAALAANDSRLLEAAATAKAEPVTGLAALEADRASVSREAGFDPSPAGMRALFAWCDEDARLAGRWNSLIETARECDRLNATNGAIIRLRRQQISAGLAVLRGEEFSAETYAASGIEDKPQAGRALAQA